VVAVGKQPGQSHGQPQRAGRPTLTASRKLPLKHGQPSIEARLALHGVVHRPGKLAIGDCWEGLSCWQAQGPILYTDCGVLTTWNLRRVGWSSPLKWVWGTALEFAHGGRDDVPHRLRDPRPRAGANTSSSWERSGVGVLPAGVCSWSAYTHEQSEATEQKVVDLGQFCGQNAEMMFGSPEPP